MTGKGIHGWRGGAVVMGLEAGEALVEAGEGDSGPGSAGGGVATRPASGPCPGRYSGPFWPQAASTPAQARAAQARCWRRTLTRMGFKENIDGL